MKNLENFQKFEPNKEVVSFKKEVTIDELPYQFYLTQYEKPGRYKLDFSVKETSFVANKGLKTMNKVFEELISFVMSKKHEGNIKEIYFFPGWDMLTLEEVEMVFYKIKDSLEKNPQAFEGFMSTSREDSLYERVIIKNEKLAREFFVHGEGLREEVFDLAEIFRNHDLTRFTSVVLDPDYAEALIDYGHIPQLEKEDIRQIVNKQIDWNENNHEARMRLYLRILERKFPHLKVDKKFDGRSGVLVTL